MQSLYFLSNFLNIILKEGVATHAQNSRRQLHVRSGRVEQTHLLRCFKGWIELKQSRERLFRDSQVPQYIVGYTAKLYARLHDSAEVAATETFDKYLFSIGYEMEEIHIHANMYVGALRARCNYILTCNTKITTTQYDNVHLGITLLYTQPEPFFWIYV